MPYSVVIVEDELHQQESLKTLLMEFPEFGLKGIAGSIDEAREMIVKFPPDLALLDVKLGQATSFDLLHSLPKIDFGIIFITSYDQYAVQAFRLAAIDYLMKPIDRTTFAEALEKFKLRNRQQYPEDQIRSLLSNLKLKETDTSARIALPTLSGFIFISVKDIIRCASDNTYTTYHLQDKRKIVVSRTLKETEQMLMAFPFFRVHHSHLINLNYIVEYVRGEGGFVRMTDGSEVDVSRRRKDGFLQQLKRS